MFDRRQHRESRVLRMKIKRWIIRNPDNSASLDSPKRSRPENPFGRKACHITIFLFPSGIIYPRLSDCSIDNCQANLSRREENGCK
ncbi:hypothetical protein CFU_3918 [Collimonas fungivorans Ter331]|uniref:Uncharacterized protein n=1 Tax=Collimonas fungivorans (strain Ter331) TaxID=1005048 RepID=G0ADW8_COLFT|nr:hypothetical protein CFU_3918 [Collimonas fungivorans Ter331]